MNRVAVAAAAAKLETLGRVIAWAHSMEPPAQFADVIVQDEYTHDVIVRVASDLFLVFDTT